MLICFVGTAISLSFTGYAISVYYRKTNKQKMIIIEEGWEHAIRVYISFLTTDTSLERHNGAKVSFKYDTSIPFKKKIQIGSFLYSEYSYENQWSLLMSDIMMYNMALYFYKRTHYILISKWTMIFTT